LAASRFPPRCRFVAYLGEPIVLDEMLFLLDSSIVEQSIHPQLCRP
jgi:hypothetical protein